MKTLVIIDMQNDFISGSLANPAAEKIVKPLCEYIKSFEGNIILTRDTHSRDYLNTLEGKNLPVEHCIKETSGWCIDDRIQKALIGKKYSIVDKPTFGYKEWGVAWQRSSLEKSEEIILTGTCTDICVVSNALILKAIYPNVPISVKADLCAGLTEEKHKAALEVMNSCQVNII